MQGRRKLAVIVLIGFGAAAIACFQVLTRGQQAIVVPVICVVLIFALAIALGSDDTRARSMGRRSPDYKVVGAKLDEIEREMKRVGLWQETPLKEEQYNFRRAFAMDTMSYDQWLQFVFIPRVKEIINTKGKFPLSSSVGAQAVREFDTYANAQALISLLSEFDRLFDG